MEKLIQDKSSYRNNLESKRMNMSEALAECIKAYDEKEFDSAFKLARPLAIKGEVEAQCLLASMYHFGLGTSVSGQKAVYWYLKAAKQGYALAYNNLFCIYIAGLGEISINNEKALLYKQEAIKCGFEMLTTLQY